jgi:hypothetical protein
MSNTYIVRKIGTGTEDDPVQPELSEIKIKYGSIIQIIEDLGDKFKIEVRESTGGVNYPALTDGVS